MTLTLGHILMVLAAIAAIVAVMNTRVALRYRRPGRGTPQYARGRLARRKAFYGLGAALVFAALCAAAGSVGLVSLGA